MDAGPHPGRRLVLALGIVALALVMALPAAGATPKNQLVSQSSSGVTTTRDSYLPNMSADGRLVAFASEDVHLVQPDANGDETDVFIRNMATGKTKLLSKSTNGVQGDGFSFAPSISADGRFVVFASDARNLIDGQTMGHQRQIYLRDRFKGTTRLVSKNRKGVPGNDGSNSPVISADGKWIAFRSRATNLSGKKEKGFNQVFATHRKTGLTLMVSVTDKGVPGNGDSEYPAISADGRFVTFVSEAADLSKKADTRGFEDVFVRDTKRRKTELVSQSTGGRIGNEYSGQPAISGSGRFIVFESRASNLIKRDRNGKDCSDIYIRDRAKGTTRLASVFPGGLQSNGSNGCSRGPDISRGGRYVAWGDDATRIGKDNYPGHDVFIRDRSLRTTKRLSNRWNNRKAAGGGNPVLSGNGRFVAYTSKGDGPGEHDSNGVADVYRTKAR